MRTTFGDYRQKMAAEASKYAAKARQITFKSSEKSSSQDTGLGTFYRRATRTQPNATVSSSDSDMTVHQSKTAQLGEGFKFNFQLQGDSEKMDADNDTKVPECGVQNCDEFTGNKTQKAAISEECETKKCEN